MPQVLLGLVLLLAATGAGHAEKTAVATFAGGCFWPMEADFDHVPGVISTTFGHTGGHVANPTYAQVSAGGAHKGEG